MREVKSDHADDRALSPGDEGQGTALLALFTAASMIVVGAVWMVGTFGGWWVLALAVALHLTMTATVIVAAFAVVGEYRRPPRAARHRGSVHRAPTRWPPAWASTSAARRSQRLENR
jgi:small-conductance mechanosensitive channel